MASNRGKQILQIQQEGLTLEARISWKPEAYSIAYNKDIVYTFLRDGRLFSAFIKGNFYQRGLNNQILHKGRKPITGQRFRLPLETLQAQNLMQRIHSEVQSLYQTRLNDLDSEPGEILRSILAWNPERLAQDGQQFQSIYAPISILPPDQYLSIVLQLSLGCSYNRCNFCNFYKDRAFRIKDLKEFETHVQAVHTFLGASNTLRRGVFLADGDALMTPQKRLVGAIEILRRYYPKLPLYAFMDAFRPGIKSLQDWQELKALGLKRVYFGIESADPQLLRFLNKPGTPDATLSEVQTLKAAGISLGLIFMLGAGGQEYAVQHREASLQWLQKISLDRDDFIFLSEFVSHRDQPYHALFQSEGLTGMNPEVRQAEQTLWLEKLKTLQTRVVPYHLQEFIY